MTWKSVARRVAAVAIPNATSASAARSDVRESSPIVGTSQVSASANATAMPALIRGAVAARTGLGSRVRLTRRRNSGGDAECPHDQGRGRDHVAAARGVVQRDGRQYERLNGQQRDGDRASPHSEHAEPERDQDPGERAVHAIPASRAAMPSKAATAPAASRRGTSRTRILATRVSVSARAAQRTASQAGRSASCHQTLSG